MTTHAAFGWVSFKFVMTCVQEKHAIFYQIVVSNVCTKVDYYSDYFKDDWHFEG